MPGMHYSSSNASILASALLAAAAGAGTSAAPPANDNCSSAMVLDGSDLLLGSVNLLEATTQPCEPNPACAQASNSVWYEFTAPTNGWLYLSAVNFYFDSIAPLVAVYDGCAINLFGDCLQPQVLGCDAATWNDQWFTWSASLQVELQAGETYLVELASNDGYGGEVFSFDLYWTPEVVNDDCSNATVIAAGEFSDVVDVLDATTQPCENPYTDCDAGLGTYHSVWYRFDASWPGMLVLDTEGSTYSMVLGAYDGCPVDDPILGCVTPAELDCDSAAAEVGAELALPVAAGESYLVRAAAGFDDINGFILNLQSQFIPFNDTCAEAAVIDSNTYDPPPFLIGGASATLNEPLEPCDSSVFGVTNSVFFSFTPDVDGEATINTFGSNYDTVLSVFDGCGILVIPDGYNQPNLIACSNDVGGLLGTLSALSDVTMVAGQTYIIKVASNDPTGSETGVLDFSFQFEPGLPDPCPADITPAGGDGIVGPADLASLLAAWGACAACPADFTADGAVGPADLAQLLANWGSCP